MLPMNSTPIYNLRIPSTKKELKYRPFLVKDEKALLVAQQSDDPTVMLDTVKEVIKSCAKSPVDVDKLASFDIEYIFMQLRAVSVGEIVELVFGCSEDHGEENEKARATVQIDVRNIKVEFPKEHESKIHLFGDVGVVMKYPTLETLKKLETTPDDYDQVFPIIADCMELIYNGDEILYIKEQKPEEVIDFLNNLTTEQFNKVQNFFRTLPALKAHVEWNCPVCGKHHETILEGLASFF